MTKTKWSKQNFWIISSGTELTPIRNHNQLAGKACLVSMSEMKGGRENFRTQVSLQSISLRSMQVQRTKSLSIEKACVGVSKRGYSSLKTPSTRVWGILFTKKQSIQTKWAYFETFSICLIKVLDFNRTNHSNILTSNDASRWLMISEVTIKSACKSKILIIKSAFIIVRSMIPLLITPYISLESKAEV